MNNHPLISIIIPTYNRAHLIGETLESVMAQTYTNWECLVVDDGSTDNTHEVANSYVLNDSRFIFVKNERKKGAQGARNTGILHAKGEFIQFFDSDDIMLPTTVETLINELQKSGADIATCYSNVLDNDDEIISTMEFDCNGDISADILNGTAYVDYNSAMIRRETLTKFGLTDEDCPSFQEWDTHIRLSKIATYTTVRKLLVNYYMRNNGTISSDKKRTALGMFYVISKHKELWRNNLSALYRYYFETIRLAKITNQPMFEMSLRARVYLSCPRFFRHHVNLLLKQKLKS